MVLHSASDLFYNLSISNFIFLAIFNPLPNTKILDLSKLIAFADDKINVSEMMISFSGKVENIVGKGEIAGYQDCLVKN